MVAVGADELAVTADDDSYSLSSYHMNLSVNAIFQFVHICEFGV